MKSYLHLQYQIQIFVFTVTKLTPLFSASNFKKKKKKERKEKKKEMTPLSKIELSQKMLSFSKLFLQNKLYFAT